MPKTTQLRRYDVKPELLEEFLEWWPSRLLPARRAYGFSLEHAYLNRATSEFTWAISVEGDAEAFAAAEAAYMASPERAGAFDGAPPTWTLASHIALVESIA